jgi:hypothetical protein
MTFNLNEGSHPDSCHRVDDILYLARAAILTSVMIASEV